MESIRTSTKSKWFWQINPDTNDASAWAEYPQDLQQKIEDGYSSGTQTIVVEINGSSYIIHYKHMLQQLQSDPSKQIPIIRKQEIKDDEEAVSTDYYWFW